MTFYLSRLGQISTFHGKVQDPVIRHRSILRITIKTGYVLIHSDF